MKKIIYITRKIPEVGLQLLKEKNISYQIGKKNLPLTKKELLKELKRKPYDGVISFLTDQIDAEVFEACPTAKVFANFAVGFNNIDLKEAEKRKILISNTPKAASSAVAEHTVALMMALTTKLVEGDQFIRSGKFKGWNPDLLVGTDLKDKKVGLIGCGEIGKKVAEILYSGFKMKVIYSDLYQNKEIEKKFKAIKKETTEVLKEADIVSLHVPLLPSTKHLINEKTLKLMKKTAFLINTSRGPVIDEKALVIALKNGIIAGAGLDVFEFEPKLVPGLNKLKNIILTPHIASARTSCRNLMAQMAALNIISALEKGQVINSVINK